MAKLLLILLFIITGCVKDPPCNQRILKPVRFDLTKQESFTYVNISSSVSGIEYKTEQVLYGNQEASKAYIDTLDLSQTAQYVPIGGKIFLEYKFFSLDGSYRIERDTVIKK